MLGGGALVALGTYIEFDTWRLGKLQLELHLTSRHAVELAIMPVKRSALGRYTLVDEAFATKELGQRGRATCVT